MTKMISAIVFLMTLAFSGTASASTINIGSQAGLYDISSLVSKINNTASISLDGTIAAHTSVTFTYTLDAIGSTGINGPANLYGQGIYHYYQNSAGNIVYTPTEGYLEYYGSSIKIALQRMAASGPDSGVYGNPSDKTSYAPLVLLTSVADISLDGLVGIFTLTNNSDSFASYATNFSSIPSGLKSASYTYKVTSLPTAPLPAALPLFGSAMLMLGAFRSKRKRS